MQEHSTGDDTHGLFTDMPQVIPEFTEPETDDRAVQTLEKDPAFESSSFINKQAIYLKFLKLWFKFSARNSTGPPQHLLTMNLYSWRLNALYDEGIKSSARQLLSWPSRLPILGNMPYINYVILL